METNAPATSPIEFLRMIRILYYVMVTGILVVSGIFIGINKLRGPIITNEAVERIFLAIVSIMAAICLFISNRIYTKRISAAYQYGLSLKEKLNCYMAALIFYLSTCEVPAMLAVICYFLYGNPVFLAITGIMFLAMLVKRPEKSRIFNELQLDSKEQMELS